MRRYRTVVNEQGAMSLPSHAKTTHVESQTLRQPILYRFHASGKFPPGLLHILYFISQNM